MQQIASFLGHVVKHGSVGRRLEIACPRPRETAPIPGLVVDLRVYSLTFFFP